MMFGQARQIEQTLPLAARGRWMVLRRSGSRTFVIAGALFTSLCIAAAVAGAGGQTTKPVLRIGYSLGNFNPALGFASGTFNSIAYASLVHENTDGTFSPELATSWRYVGRGNKVFELTLRHNARFSDGMPVNADAVKKWLEYFPTASGPLAAELGPVRSITAIGKWTVRITLRTPNPIVPEILSEEQPWGQVVSPKALVNPKVLATQTFGAGPYVLVPSESVGGDHATFIPNKFYYDKTEIKFSKVLVKSISAPTSMLQAMQANQIDLGLGDITTAATASGSGLKVISSQLTWAALLFMDLGGTISKPLADVRVRQAMNYAIDRKAIVNALYGKYGSPSTQLNMPDGVDAKYNSYYSYNPSKARSLLAAAGYADGFSFDVTTYIPLWGNLVQLVAKYLEAVKIHINVADPNGDGLFSGKYPVWICGACGVDPTTLFYYGFLKPKGLLQQHGWIDPVLNNMWLKGIRATNASKYWHQMMARTVTQAYSVPIARLSEIWYTNKSVKGVLLSPHRQMDWLITELAPTR